MFINVLFRHKSKTKVKHSDKCCIESGKAYLKALLYKFFLKDSFFDPVLKPSKLLHDSSIKTFLRLS